MHHQLQPEGVAEEEEEVGTVKVKSPLMLEFCHFHLKEAIPSLNKKCISAAIEPKEEKSQGDSSL